MVVGAAMLHRHAREKETADTYRHGNTLRPDATAAKRAERLATVAYSAKVGLKIATEARASGLVPKLVVQRDAAVAAFDGARAPAAVYSKVRILCLATPVLQQFSCLLANVSTSPICRAVHFPALTLRGSLWASPRGLRPSPLDARSPRCACNLTGWDFLVSLLLRMRIAAQERFVTT